jgi:hypothetical protein
MQHYWDSYDEESKKYYGRERTFNNPSPWQLWGHLVDKGSGLLTSDNTLSTTKAPTASDKWNAPSAVANNVFKSIIIGEPIAISTYATDGHVMVIRGGVVDHNGDVQCLIINDPYGTLAGQDSIYDRSLDLLYSVRARGSLNKDAPLNKPDDVIAVQDILRYLGYYNGDVNGICNGDSEQDATVQAIIAFQKKLKLKHPDGRIDPNGKTEKQLNQKLEKNHVANYSISEHEKNASNSNTGDEAERGKHVYYNNEIKGTKNNKSWKYTLKQSLNSFRITKSTPMTITEIAKHLVKGN